MLPGGLVLPQRPPSAYTLILERLAILLAARPSSLPPGAQAIAPNPAHPPTAQKPYVAPSPCPPTYWASAPSGLPCTLNTRLPPPTSAAGPGGASFSAATPASPYTAADPGEQMVTSIPLKPGGTHLKVLAVLLPFIRGGMLWMWDACKPCRGVRVRARGKSGGGERQGEAGSQWLSVQPTIAPHHHPPFHRPEQPHPHIPMPRQPPAAAPRQPPQVSNANKREYVLLKAHKMLVGTVEAQMSALIDAFHSIIPRDLLEKYGFTSQELQLVVCGEQRIDAQDLQLSCKWVVARGGRAGGGGVLACGGGRGQGRVLQEAALETLRPTSQTNSSVATPPQGCGLNASSALPCKQLPRSADSPHHQPTASHLPACNMLLSTCPLKLTLSTSPHPHPSPPQAQGNVHKPASTHLPLPPHPPSLLQDTREPLCNFGKLETHLTPCQPPPPTRSHTPHPPAVGMRTATRARSRRSRGSGTR